MADRALILGGTGQIGRACAATLARAGWEVVALSRGEREVPDALAALGVVHRRVDRREPEALVAAAGEGAEVIVDVVGYDERDAQQLLALRGHVGGVIAVSSASVYADAQGRTLDEASDAEQFPRLPIPIPESQATVPPGPATYSTRKVALERTLLEQDLIPATVVRPCAVHGPGATGAREWWVVGRACDRRPYLALAHAGGATFHPTSTRNLAELVRLAAERPGTRVLNCGDPDPPSVRDLVRIVAAVVDYDPIEVLLPGPPRGPVGESPWTAPQPFVLDMTAAATLLGYRPVVSYSEAVRETCAWLLAETAKRPWQEVLPSLAAAGDAVFPYELEDQLLRELVARGN